MNSIYNLTSIQVALAYIFVLITLLILKAIGINKQKELYMASIRMSLQLVLVGYLLVWVFNNPSPLITFTIIIIMECFAVYTVFKKFKNKITRELKLVIAPSLALSTLFCVIYFVLIVVKVSPWYSPQYFIPISGMIIGNSMTGVSLGVKYLTDNMAIQKPNIEQALMLGATPKAACQDIIINAFDSSIMPTINSMLGMGIVFLPGMMTGQILSGVSPITAISYQIAIMLGILGSVAISVFFMLHFGYRTFFNKDDQLN